MVCLHDQLPLLKYGNHGAVSYEARWLDEEITKSAAKAGHEDWFFAKDITKAVLRYLRHRHQGDTITIEELYNKVEHVLQYLGCGDIAESLEIGLPPLQIPLNELAKEAGLEGERAFFSKLTEKIADTEGSGAKEIVCDGIRCAAKRLCNVTRWTPESELLAGEIVDFIGQEVLRCSPEDSVNIVIK